MAASKAALKAIKGAIDGSDFAKASALATELLQNDPQNYNALMFLGFAEEKLKHLGEAEKALNRAVVLKPQDVQPYKGLIRLYEQQGAEKADAYHDTAFGLASIYAQDENREQCQNVINQYELFVKKYGTKAQYRRALGLMLPTSPLYPVLESRVPHPSHNYQRILESVQAEEKLWIDNQIGERRTRLGARLEMVKTEVKSEAITMFNIEQCYQDLIDWTRDDDIRHALDQELLQRMLDNLLALPPALKPQQRDRVLEKANGMVIIKQQFALAWNIALQWVDSEKLSDWDPTILFQYLDFFPDSGLAKTLKGWLYGPSAPFPLPKSDDPENPPRKLTDVEQLNLMKEGLEEYPDSMLAHRLMAYVYLQLDEHETAAEMARISINLYAQAEKNYAMPLQDSLDAVNLMLGRALVVYQSPRHHPEARKIFDNILKRKPQLTDALLGIGLVYEEDEDYAKAAEFLGKATEEAPSDLRISLEYAWCRALSHSLQDGLRLLEAFLERLDDVHSEDQSMRAELLYRIAYCKWHLNNSPQARKNKSGPYQYLVDALKHNSSYAPAYTLLGLYFLNYGKNKKRAQTAFYRAFEYSTSELLAAEQLAEMYALDSEWDTVELIAQRVVDSGKARPAPGSKKKAHSWPFAALGIVQMSRAQYSLSIVSFQHALRISPDSYHYWVGLGESYHNSGRFVAASRAFLKAQGIDHGLSQEEAWFALYMLANVQRELGVYEEAISAYKRVLQVKPGELGVLLSLLQTQVDFGWARIHQGHFGHAAELAHEAFESALQIVGQKTEMFNLWKAVGDACAVLSAVGTFAESKGLEILVSLFEAGATSASFEMLQDIDHVKIEDLRSNLKDTEATCQNYAKAAVLAYKRGVHTASSDNHAQAISWFNLGWAEHHVYLSLVSQEPHDNEKSSRMFLKAAVKSFKFAIEREASNADFWNALGVVTMRLNPKVSQHALVRSLHLNDRSARTWTNLGALYTIHHELELANEAFTKAQSADPEFAAAWIGQGLLATLFGKQAEATSLFKHAYEIADSYSIPTKRHFVSTMFDIISRSATGNGVNSVLEPLFALRQLEVQSPSDNVSKHLIALFAERVFEYEISQLRLEPAIRAAEAEYEAKESNHSLARFAQAKADIARQCLGRGDYESAIENATFALDVSDDDTVGPEYTTLRNKWRLSSQVTAGLAHAFLKNMPQSIKFLREAAETSKTMNSGSVEPKVIVILAQVLWAAGSDSERDAARNQLFECITEYPDHAHATILLAIIAILDDDMETLEVATDDLKVLRTKPKILVTEKLQIAKVLAAILTLKNSSDQSNIAVTQDATLSIMTSPHQPQGWTELAKISLDNYAGQMAIKTALRQLPPNGALTSEDLAKTYLGGHSDESLKQATMIAPWMA